MPCILHIETATPACSVAVSHAGSSIFHRFDASCSSHAGVLGSFVAEAVAHIRELCLTVDAIAVSAGPGSYTGLRIGLSEAKGLCFGWDVPLIAVPTLKIVAGQAVARARVPAEAYVCPLIDARRMEVYAAVYDAHGEEVRPVRAEVIDEGSFHEYLCQRPVIFAGTGAEKCKSVIRSANAVFFDHVLPDAQAMLPLAEAAFARQDFVDTAYFEPLYLKEFQATVARNRLLI